MEAMSDFAQLHLSDPIQWRYEVIRPVVVIPNRTITQRAQETQLHPDTVGRLSRRFQQQGMLGLLPDKVEAVAPSRGHQIPEAIVTEIARLKALYDRFEYRELARIIPCQCDDKIDDKTVKKLWQQSPLPEQVELPFGIYHHHPDRYLARLQVMKLDYQGWNKVSISRFLKVSRPTLDLWIRHFEANEFSGLEDTHRGPHTAPRKVCLALMIDSYHLQKRHRDAGRFRIWSLLARTDISERTVARVIALNKQVYDDIPQVPDNSVKTPPGPHPYQAIRPHPYWFIDGRMMDFAIDGVKWWSLIVLDGYARTRLAGAMAPSEASWAALSVLYSACLRYGTPESFVSDSGGAYLSDDFEAACERLTIDHQTMVSRDGQSYMNLMETPFNIQRRL